jgi:hypothetical protein
MQNQRDLATILEAKFAMLGLKAGRSPGTPKRPWVLAWK